MKLSAYAIRLAALLGLALLLAGPALAADHEVVVGPGFVFIPANITINEGDSITWVWAGGFHSVRSGAGCVADGGFDSGATTVVGTNFSFTYNTAGTYDYHCGVGIHCSLGMAGTVTVVTAPPPPPPPSVPSMGLWALGATALLIATATLGSLAARSRRARGRTNPTGRP